MMSAVYRCLSLALAALIALPAPAAEPAAAAADVITLEKIMSDPDWIGSLPENPAWADDGRSVFFERKRLGETVRDLYQLSIEGGEARLVEDAERGSKSYGEGDWSDDRTRKVFSREGDVFVHDIGRGTLTALTRTNEEESGAFFLVGDRQVAFRRGDGWFVRDLDSGVEWQTADLRAAKDPAEPEVEKSFLEEQEERLFDVLREGERRAKTSRRVEEERQRKDPLRPRLPWYLGDEIEIQDSLLSPTGDYLLVVFGDEGDDSKQDQMPQWVTKSALVETIKLRPHVGAQVVKTPRVALLDLRNHVRHDLDLTTLPGITDDPLAELREAAELARKEREQKREAEVKLERGEKAAVEPPKAEADVNKRKKDGRGKAAKSEPEKPQPKPRAVEIDGFGWSDDGSWAVFQAYSADNKERWIVGVDAAAGKMVPLERITDPAWINWAFRDIGWMPATRTLWYLSEESGYSQLYLRPVDGRRRQLTRGSFEIRGASDGSGPAVARDGKSFVVVANREHPGIWEAYRVSAENGELTRLSSAGGENDVLVSPDERSLLITHGRATRPPELYLQPASAGAAARQLTESRSAEFAAITWAEPRYVTIPPKHGQAPIHARLYLPTPAASAQGALQPAVQFLHGAGYLQNADQGWSSYFREFMFHSLLARHGYVVLDMDFRASAGYGRDWRTAIYRVMGTPELEDMRDGVDWLVANHGVDRARVGAYGGSYGGFLTVMALFREPDLFAAGAALRTVTDWAHYNHPYTSNILNTPEVDPEAYAIASPIEYAAGLQKPLLLCHGMVDDNVVFQDTVRLVQRLIELKKENFETAIYPVEPHGFMEPTSWLDEYRRICKLFERHVGSGGGEACSG